MDVDDLVKQWRVGVRISHRAHFDAAAWCDRMGKLLGVPAVALTTLLGTAIFATIKSSPGVTAKAFAGLVSIAAAILTALQTFLSFADRAQRHREAALRYGELRRELDDLVAYPDGEPKRRMRLEELRARWNETDAMAPVIPPRFQTRARELVLGNRDHDAK